MAQGNGSSATPILLIGGAIAAYLYWPQLSAMLGIAATPAATSTLPAGAQLTNSSPTINTAGATPLGTQGCFAYNNVISCPPGISPPAPAAPINNCQPGYSPDANGVCTEYSDAALLAGLNSIQWNGTQAIPTEQINRIDPQILAQYGTQTGITPGSVLAYMIGLGGNAPNGTVTTGSDGNIYTFTSGMWLKTGLLANPLVHFYGSGSTGALTGARLGRISRIGAALPITNNTLIEASHNPDTAAVLGNNPAALLTVPQWNYFYTQASGVVQSVPAHPTGAPGARVNAATYHQIRQAADLPVRLGTIRRSAPGAFPLGGITTGPIRRPYIPPQNRTIYRIPGRGSVPAAGKMGLISSGGGNHRWTRSPFPRAANWRVAE
jgi:hypothetical protein